jgi:hypothetical protein
LVAPSNLRPRRPQIKVQHSPTVRDAFVSEVVKLSPPELKQLDLTGAINLHR